MLKKIKVFIKNNIPYTNFLYSKFIKFILYVKGLILLRNQKKIYKKLCLVAKKNKRKLKIAFLVNENEKWCCQSLYNKLTKSKHFEPVIFLTSLTEFQRPDIEDKYNKNFEFFYKNCADIQLVYNNKTKQFDDLKKYSPDIVVYQQPWFIPDNQNLYSISKFALPIYIPYCFVEEYGIIKSHIDTFYYLLFKEYLSHELIKKEYKNKGYKRNNLKVVGYTKIEEYSNNKQYEKKYIIYAPHYSVRETTLKLGTFDWNGKFILDYAKNHTEFNWIFKPHPRCKEDFLRLKIFKNIDEINEYYEQWNKLGTLYDEGNYIDLFKQTKCLITDCASFLIEFLPTEMPVINLRRKDSVYISDITNEIVKSYYQVYELEELKQVFNDVLENNNDPKKEERLNLIKKLNLVRNASDNIINDLEETFYKNIY